jgi:hypothetical protein
MHKSIFVCLALAATLCGKPATAQTIHLEDGTVARSDSATITIEGIITPKVVTEFAKNFDSQVKLVVVKSEGGGTADALEIAERIQRYHIAVRVKEYCLSSCANYIVVASPSVTVDEGAIIGWHGGHSYMPFLGVTRIEEMSRAAELLLREQQLYLRANVSIELIVYSGFLTTGYRSKEGDSFKREYDLWVPCRSELARLGLERMTFEGAEMNHQSTEDALQMFGFKGQRVFTGSLHSHIPEFLR